MAKNVEQGGIAKKLEVKMSAYTLASFPMSTSLIV